MPSLCVDQCHFQRKVQQAPVACVAGVLGIDNFNDYYPVSLKRARQLNAESAGVYTVDGDINDVELLKKLFKVCQFTDIVHMAAQVHLYAISKQQGRNV